MRRGSWVGVGLLICAAVVAWHYVSRRGGGVSAPETVLFSTLRAPQRGFSGVGDWAGDVGRAVVRRGSIVQENEAFKARVDFLEGENARLRRYLKENQELRAMLQMRPTTGGVNVPADVVSVDFSAYARRISLNIGRGQGVRPKDVVFTPRGLVGQVIAVGGGPLPTSQVLLLSDRESSVGAMTARSFAKGIVQGTGEGGCTMSYLDVHSDVREGDLVITSGDSTIFPRGILIGRVARVSRNKTYSTMAADIEPAAPLDQLAAVFVRTKAGP
jgi:rod shape-determining protein MreC